MAHSFCNIKESAEFVKAAANILFSTFSAINKDAWPTEEEAKKAGIIGIVLGTDDETNSTSLSACSLTGENIFSEISNIRNRKNHPYEFYKKCGYSIIGAIPNANGINKPDIWMWKNI
ncbi:hypothetical protein AGMMS49579_09530 [Spirochaetia bacterium]|nr:hypothetical protein AGMMS49579_09530 [Spirochaetia bacterium]